jgi:SAM-dependent methyltransferase
VEPHEYETLFNFETFYWWYRGLHLILLDTLHSLDLPARPRVLDAGCGTGQNLANIKERVTGAAYGFDLSPFAAAYWKKRGIDRACVASINEIPFASNSFDVVVSVDVLECEAVVEEKAYREMWRLLKPGGYMLLVVPAYDWLLSEEHHRAVRAVRRYSRKKILELLATQPTQIVRITHLFGSVLPAVACYRYAERFSSRVSDGRPRSELRPLSPVLNTLLFELVNLERHLLRKLDIPFGSSIMVTARKTGE